MLTLRSDCLEARLLPEVGGCLLSLDHMEGMRRQHILIAPSVEAAQSGQTAQSAHFLMLPWVNRIPGNRLLCEGDAIAIQPNTPEPLALHGIGWQRPWSVVDTAADRCTLQVESPPDYPIPFRAIQGLRLEGSSLLISVTLENSGNHRIPAGVGFHPYFPRDAQTRLAFEADWFWLEGPGHMPTDAIRVPPELDFREGRLLPERWRANCYSGWHGPAVIDQPTFGYRVVMTASEGLDDLMFYTPPDESFWALEPQSHTTAQVDTRKSEPAAQPMRRLGPGETLRAWMQIEVVRL